MRRYILQNISRAFSNPWAVGIGLLPILLAALNLYTYWKEKQPTLKDFLGSNEMLLFALSLLLLIIVIIIAFFLEIKSSNPDIEITRPSLVGLDPQGGQNWFLFDIYNDELDDVTNYSVFLRRLIRVYQDGTSDEIIFHDQEDNRSAFIWKNNSQDSITLVHKRHELLKIAEEYSVEGEDGLYLRLFLPFDPNHPYERTNMYEKIQLEVLPSMDFEIDLIFEFEVDGKIKEKSICPRKYRWRLSYKKDNGLIFENGRPHYRRPDVYDVIFEEISKHQMKKALKAKTPIVVNPDIEIETHAMESFTTRSNAKPTEIQSRHTRPKSTKASKKNIPAKKQKHTNKRKISKT